MAMEREVWADLFTLLPGRPDPPGTNKIIFPESCGNTYELEHEQKVYLCFSQHGNTHTHTFIYILTENNKKMLILILWPSIYLTNY